MKTNMNSKSLLGQFLLLLFLINCISTQIGNGYTTKSKILVFSKPDRNSPVAFEIKENSKFLILDKISQKESKHLVDWLKIKNGGLIGFLEYNKNNSTLIFLNLEKPKYGLVVATSLFVRSEPTVDSKPMEKLSTKDVVEIIEDSESSISVNGKKGFWIKVKTKSQNVGFVFSPYIMIKDSIESLSSLTDFETNETGWAYIKKRPEFIYSLNNNILKKNKNDQINEDQYYLIKSRFVTKNGKVFFRLLKQEASLEDWYSELAVTKIADCYIPAESIILSNKFASLYVRATQDYDRKKRKIFEFLSQEIDDDINPQYSDIEYFEWKKRKFHVVRATEKYENDECRGCFLPEPYNLVYVLEEKGNLFNLIFKAGGSRSASFYQSDLPTIIINDSPPPEGDDSPSRIISSEFVFNGKEFLLKSNPK